MGRPSLEQVKELERLQNETADWWAKVFAQGLSVAPNARRLIAESVRAHSQLDQPDDA